VLRQCCVVSAEQRSADGWNSADWPLVGLVALASYAAVNVLRARM
jgi:hypothetical protein